jgi:hypothetical protein
MSRIFWPEISDEQKILIIKKRCAEFLDTTTVTSTLFGFEDNDNSMFEP